MAYQYKNRIRGTTITTGTGTYTVLAAPTGFQDFNQVTSTRQITYCAVLGANWEVGIGTLTVGGSVTLSRDTILESSNAGAPVNWGAGTKEIFLVDAAQALEALWFDGTLRHGTFTGELKGAAPFVTGIVTPTALGTGQTDDWAPTITNVSRIRVSCGSGGSLTGMVGGADGKIVYLTNVGANTLIIRDEHSGSAAANRFGMNGDQLLPSNVTIGLMYDSSISRWSKLS